MRLPGLEGAVIFNAYYLQDEAASALRRGEAASAVVEEVFAKVAALGVRAVRTNGFNDLCIFTASSLMACSSARRARCDFSRSPRHPTRK